MERKINKKGKRTRKGEIREKCGDAIERKKKNGLEI